VAGEYAEMGFIHVYALKGGVTGWKAAGYPIYSGRKEADNGKENLD
jgi:rhodanese-related sulfurtransferase